jgi:CheY-like chemotaxis protein
MNSPLLILLCEDCREDALLLRRAFAKAGLSHQILDVRNGQQAINYLAGSALFADRSLHPLPALVLLDIKMPLMDGFEMLSWLKTRPDLKSLPVLVLAGSNSSADIQRAIELGAHDYLIKPRAWPGYVALAQTLHDRWLKKPWVNPPVILSTATPQGPRPTA